MTSLQDRLDMFIGLMLADKGINEGHSNRCIDEEANATAFACPLCRACHDLFTAEQVYTGKYLSRLFEYVARGQINPIKAMGCALAVGYLFGKSEAGLSELEKIFSESFKDTARRRKSVPRKA